METRHITRTITETVDNLVYGQFAGVSIAVVPSSQVLPGYLITAPPSVCVPDVIGALAVKIHKNKKVSHNVCGHNTIDFQAS